MSIPSDAGSGAAAGLVHSETSDTRVVVDSHSSRLKSMRKGVLNAARLVQTRFQNRRGRRWKCVMVDLTYRDTRDFGARNITEFVKRVRHWAHRRGFVVPYVWVLERGEKHGRVHYHVLLWLPPGITLPKPDKQGWWPHGFTRIAWARNAVGYVAKYASKESAAPPKGARMHGCGGLESEERAERSWWAAPAWVREHFPSPEFRPTRALGGGWCSRLTGEWVPSPWVVVGWAGTGPIIERRDCHGYA